MSLHLCRLLAVCVVLSLSLAGCEKKPAASTESAETQSKPGETAEATDADEDTSASTAKAYPLTVCIVAGEPLGSMGDPVRYVYEGQEYRFCCEGCIDEFKQSPEKYVAVLYDKVNKGQVDLDAIYPETPEKDDNLQ